MKKLVALLILSLLGYINIFGSEINESELSSEINLVYEVREGVDAIFFSIKDGNVEIQPAHINNMEELIELAEYLKAHKDQMAPIRSGNKITCEAVNSINFKSSYVSGKNEVSLKSPGKVSLINSILKSKKIILSLNELESDKCFIDTDLLHIHSIFPESLCRSIYITFKTNGKLKFINGVINFKSNETSEDFLIAGVYKVKFVLSSKILPENITLK